MKNMENSRSKAPKTAIVVGAGIAGISTALYLQYDGHKVEILDPELPGSMTSFGNAGILSAGSVLPEGHPGLWKQLPKLLMDPIGPLTIRPGYLPRLLPWLLRFMAKVVLASQQLPQIYLQPFQNLGKKSYRLDVIQNMTAPLLSHIKWCLLL